MNTMCFFETPLELGMELLFLTKIVLSRKKLNYIDKFPDFVIKYCSLTKQKFGNIFHITVNYISSKDTFGMPVNYNMFFFLG